MRILLIEPDQAVAGSIELMLRSEAFNVYTTDLGEEGVDLGKMFDYDCILLANPFDLPRLEVLRQLRVAKCKTPVLVLSGMSSGDDQVKCLGAGADDYLSLPFHPDVLVARIHAVVRRTRGHAESLVVCGPLCLNINTRTVTLAGQPFHLTGKEYAMVELLALRKGSLITKEMFLNHLYGGMDEPEIKIIDVFICKIRKRLGEDAALIRTVWGRGYLLSELEVAPEDAGSVGDFASDPPIHVTRRTALEANSLTAKQRFGVPVVESPPLVPTGETRR